MRCRSCCRNWAQTQIRYLTFAFLYVISPWTRCISFLGAGSANMMGPATLVEIAIFVAVVLVGLVHGARRGLLRWL
ncbi:MAG: NADH-quinone oxidoreductase subunit A [Tetrasphaera sp.]|nr:NADH-quinone oxidoreductase subunit A [Tetrasphaera sp.]